MFALAPEYQLVAGREQAVRLLQRIGRIPLIACDTETTGLTRHKDHIVFWSLATENERWCLDRPALDVFRPFLEDPERTLIFQNANYDAWMLLNSGVDLHRHGRKDFRRFDTAVMHMLLADNQPHGLKEMAGAPLEAGGLDLPMKSFRKTFESAETDVGKKLLSFFESDPGRVADYASLDAWATYQLYLKFLRRLKDSPLPQGGSLYDYYCRFEQPMHDVLWQMERRGALLDCDYLRECIPPIEQEMFDIEKAIASQVGRLLNIGSPKQLVELFYTKSGDSWVDDHGNPPIKMTDGGASGKKSPSVDEEVLAFRAEKLGCPLSQQILRHRHLGKLLGTYLVGMLQRCDSEGRIHTSYAQHTAKTGRLSSVDPNLQNIPRPENDELQLRRAFVAPPGYVLGDSDYSQLEMFIAASVSNEPEMLNAIRAGRDMHCWTVHKMYGEPYEEVKAAYDAKEAKQKLTPRQKELCNMRSRGKSVGFGILYGKTAYGLSEDLKITPEEAQDVIDAYYAGYPALERYFDENVRFGLKHGYVVTELGRRRQIQPFSQAADGEKVTKATLRAGIREANNYPIQGRAAEITKGAQIRLYLDDSIWDAGVRQILQVHDEIIPEVPVEISRDRDFVKRWEHLMTHPFGDDVAPLKVPLRAELRFGANWLEAK